MGMTFTGADVAHMVSGLGGGAMNIAGGIAQSVLNNQASEDRMKLQYNLNEQAAQNADTRTRLLYHNLYSPKAQLEQLMQAGLSPSVFAGEGAAGKQGVAGAQGAGAGLLGPTYSGFDHFGSDAAAIANVIADTKKKNAETEGQEQSNADDPVIKSYIADRQEAENEADETETREINSAWNNCQAQLTARAGFSESSSWNFTKSKSDAEGKSQGWMLSTGSSQGESKSFGVSSSNASSESNSVGATANAFGGGVNASRGKSNSHSEGESGSESHNESANYAQSQQEANNWAKSVLDAQGKSESKSGNRREAEDILAKFYLQVQNIQDKCQKRRERAQEYFDLRKARYEENLQKRRSK